MKLSDGRFYRLFLNISEKDAQFSYIDKIYCIIKAEVVYHTEPSGV